MVSELRKFGLSVGLVFSVLFGLFFPWLFARPFPVWPWVLGGALVFPALIYPPVLKPIHFVWMKLAHALGWFNTRVLLTVMYFLLLTPYGWLLRLLGKSPLDKGRDCLPESYRLPSAVEPAERMRDPF